LEGEKKKESFRFEALVFFFKVANFPSGAY